MALDYLTADTQEVKEALTCIADVERALLAAERNYRPVICGERYMTGDEVCEYLHISPRTLQTLRDMRRIPFTSVGERLIIYPESGIQEVLNMSLRKYRFLVVIVKGGGISYAAAFLLFLMSNNYPNWK